MSEWKFPDGWEEDLRKSAERLPVPIDVAKEFAAESWEKGYNQGWGAALEATRKLLNGTIDAVIGYINDKPQPPKEEV